MAAIRPLICERASHRNRRHLRHVPVGSGDFHQLSGVIRRLAAAVQDQVVASPLALDAHSPRGEPDQRIDPVKGANNPRDGLGQAIPPLHVGEFVQQNDAAPLRWPLRGFGRQQDHRPPPTPRQRHEVVRGLPQADWPPQAQCVAGLLQQERPVGGLQREPLPTQPASAGHGPAARKSSPAPLRRARSQRRRPARWR